jgi:hypothetical protein
MRFWHSLSLMMCLLCGLLVSSGAYAQADENTEKAKALFGKGKAELDAGHFPEALVAFQDAYALKPLPAMLKNIAVVHESMGNLPGAVEYYTKYLDSSPKDADKINEAVANLKKALAANWATVELTTEPAGASVWVGTKAGPPRGVTPFTLQVPSGKQTLVLEKPGFQVVTRPISLAAGRVTPVGIALPPLMPILVVRSTPVGAEVSLDGRPVGKTPFNQAVMGGAHKLEVKLGGFAPFQRDIELNAAHTASAPLLVDVPLSERAASGELALTVDRKGSQILIDGQPVGSSPLASPLSLPEGLHKLEVRPEDGGKAHEEMVAINAGQTTRTRVTFGGVEEVVDSGGGGGGISGRTWSYIILGTGGALVATGGVFGILANSANGELDDCRKDADCKRTDAELDKADAVKSKALLTDILLGSGIAVAGAGLAVFFMSDDPAGKPPVTIVPTIGGAAAVGAFEF